MDINKLLEKYWAAETSLSEEAELHKYFQSDMISEEHKSLKLLFNTFDNESQVSIPKQITPKLNTTKVFSLQRISIAASIIVIFSLMLNLYNSKTENDNYVKIDNQEEAVLYTLQALALVSNKLDKGTQSISKSIEPLEKANILIH